LTFDWQEIKGLLTYLLTYLLPCRLWHCRLWANSEGGPLQYVSTWGCATGRPVRRRCSSCGSSVRVLCRARTWRSRARRDRPLHLHHHHHHHQRHNYRIICC